MPPGKHYFSSIYNQSIVVNILKSLYFFISFISFLFSVISSFKFKINSYLFSSIVLVSESENCSVVSNPFLSHWLYGFWKFVSQNTWTYLPLLQGISQLRTKPMSQFCGQISKPLSHGKFLNIKITIYTPISFLL